MDRRAVMDRREFVSTVVVSLFASPFPVEAQPPGRIYRLGILAPTVPFSSGMAGRIPTAMRELGHVEGQNLIVESRYAEGKLDRRLSSSARAPSLSAIASGSSS